MNILLSKPARALTALAAFAVLPAMSHAGYIAITGIDSVFSVDTGSPGTSVGDSFTIGSAGAPAGTFSAFLPDSGNDPQIAASDLNFYRYALTAVAQTVTGNVAEYTGSYTIFYDQNLDGINNDGLLVSQGNLDLTATYTSPYTASLVGSLTQTSGPNNPNFADLSYGGHPVVMTGTYATDVNDPSHGSLQSVLRQNAAPVPEPASIAALSVGVIALVRRRRKV